MCGGESVLCYVAFSFQPLESRKRGMGRHWPVGQIHHVCCSCLLGSTAPCFSWKQNMFCGRAMQPVRDTGSDMPVTLTCPPRHHIWIMDVLSIHSSSLRAFSELLCQNSGGKFLTTESSVHGRPGCVLLLGFATVKTEWCGFQKGEKKRKKEIGVGELQGSCESLGQIVPSVT